MKKFLAALLMCSSVFAQPVVNQTMGDDGYVEVPLQFNFPYYGQTFNNSWMYDNGVVSFKQPGTVGALSPWQWSAQPLSQAQGNYFIATLWADLAPVAGITTYTTQGNTTYQKYSWNSIAEYYSIYGGTNIRLNSFSLQIEPSGKISSTYTGVNLMTSNIAIGTVGDVAKGEYNQVAYYPNGTVLTSVPNWSVPYTGDACAYNPLSSPDCPGYTTAYLNQQCTFSQLYSPACPGYAQAYFDNQCSINPLYSQLCPGYEQALAQSNTTSNTSTETKVAVVSDPTVNQVVTSTATSTSPAQSATATVPLVSAPTTAVTTVMPTETKQEEKKNVSSSSVSQTTTTQSTTTEAKPTAKQELQARREAVAKAKAAEDGKNVANEMGKVDSMEKQKDMQNVVIAAMGYSPAFEAYKFKMPDGVGYKPFSIYANQTTVDNRSTRRMFGGSDRLYDEMVNSQYNKGN